jgi:predicted PurR-regulated permease PerM
LANNIFDLPFFAFGIVFLFSRIHDLLKKYKKSSRSLNFLLAFFAALLIVALIYFNIGLADI